MKNKKVFFHVGTIKTGSTLVQKFFHDNQEAIRALGVDYPYFSPPRLDLPRYANADFLLQEGFNQKYVTDMIAASPCDRILISEEGLLGHTQVLKSPAFDDCEKTAIIYVRKPADLVASWAGENAMPYNFRQKDAASGRGVVHVSEGLAIYCSAYRSMLDTFLNNFAEADDLTLIVREYDFDKFSNHNIVEDILSVILDTNAPTGVRSIWESYENKAANIGKSRKYCDISALCAKIIKSYQLDAAYTRSLVDEVYAACTTGDERKVIDTLSDGEISTILETLQPVYERLHRLGYRSDSENFVRGLAPAVYGSERPPYVPVTEDEVRTIVADILVKKYVTNAHIQTVRAHGADKNTLTALREDVKNKTFAVQSLTGQRERLKRLISIIGQMADPENVGAILRAVDRSKSQFLQEMFALTFAKGRHNGFFVEFGACDGQHLSNTMILEAEFGWRGILAEPARTWAQALKANRTSSIDLRCVSSQTGASVEFWEAERPGTSRIAKGSGGTNPIAERYIVETVSLLDLLREHNAPSYIDFLSIDTEGTEHDILATFDFGQYRFGFISVEEHELDQGKIPQLLQSHGYEPLFPRMPKQSKWISPSGFDVWYVPRDVLSTLAL